MDYIRNLAKENALEERYFAEATLRMDNDKPIKGYIVVLGN
jgi:predicted TPR repeat methyltransferase